MYQNEMDDYNVKQYLDDIDGSRNGIIHVNIIDFLLRDDLLGK